MKTFNRFGAVFITAAELCGIAILAGPEALATPFRVGGPVCQGGVAVFVGPADGGAPGAVPVAAGAGPVVYGPLDLGGAGGPSGVAAPAEATLTDVVTPTSPCSAPVTDLAGFAGPAAPMAFPGPVPVAPVPAAPVAPPFAPVPVVPGAPPPVPFVAPGPAGAAAASPLAGVLTDASGVLVDGPAK